MWYTIIMKRIVIGILAHVDSGKTTLSEGLLFKLDTIRKQGRVDHRDSFLDTDEIERDRGITIFSKQAVIRKDDFEFTLLDTPGHTDFSAETERTLSVLDYAILVVSGSEGVQSHTKTLWNMLEKHRIPTFVFVNKMDISAYSKEYLMNNLKNNFSDCCVEFDEGNPDFTENVALCDENLTSLFLESEITTDDICASVSLRKVFPVSFGSALKLEGIDEFIETVKKHTLSPNESKGFGGKVFKITEDEKGNRLTHLKITGGELSVKEVLNFKNEKGEEVSEKVNEIRVYSGVKHTSVQKAYPGMVVSLTGLTQTFAGQGMGFEKNSAELMSEPIFTYRVIAPDGTDPHFLLANLRKLASEETKLDLTVNEHLKEIHISLMGEVQLEVIKSVVKKRFDMDIDFEQSGLVFKETIREKVEGVGHYEPLRHYAEVHLLLEPLKRGSGIVFDTKAPEDELDKNWQRLILTHLKEKTHIGVLTGSPITDIKITLVSGRAHLKHTEGGDFRQATYRAVRQGLMMTENILLEPIYSFSLELPHDNIGRAMTDIEHMGGTFEAPETFDEYSLLKGCAPVRKIRDYGREVTVYTKGKGRLALTFKGYEECSDSEIIESFEYNPESDLENTPDSVFCTKGAGFGVKWNDVYEHMHLPLLKDKEETPVIQPKIRKSGIIAGEDELIEIFERTYGKIQRKLYRPMETAKVPSKEFKYKAKPQPEGPEYLLVDGYNIIFADEEMKKLAEDSLEYARYSLINRLCNYRMVRNREVILVFDAYKVKNNPGEKEKINNITVVYTKEAETADAYIEKVTNELGKKHRVFVATSDGLEQLIILGRGALRLSASAFLAELATAEKEIEEFLDNQS